MVPLQRLRVHVDSKAFNIIYHAVFEIFACLKGLVFDHIHYFPFHPNVADLQTVREYMLTYGDENATDGKGYMQGEFEIALNK